jgi:hypothetical protein
MRIFVNGSRPAVLGTIAAVALVTLACSSTAPSEVRTSQTPAQSGASPSTPGTASTTCEITALDNERFVPPVSTLTVRIGQTITFAGRITNAFGALPSPPFTYMWKTFGGPVFGQQTTSDPLNSVQHVFASTGSQDVAVEVSGSTYSIVFPSTSFCHITVVPRP